MKKHRKYFSYPQSKLIVLIGRILCPRIVPKDEIFAEEQKSLSEDNLFSRGYALFLFAYPMTLSISNLVLTHFKPAC